MSDIDPPDIAMTELRNGAEPETVVIRAHPVTAIVRAAGSAPALALAALILATATMLAMSAANDVANAHLFRGEGFNNLAEIRWSAGSRLVIAGVALLIALIAGGRYSRSLPATHYTFSADGEEAVESIEGDEPPAWVGFLVGSAVVVSILGIVLNGIALILTLNLHPSPNFGIPQG